MTVHECYRILGLKTDADMDMVKSAFRKKAFKLHPDLNPSPKAADEFRKVNEAYVILKKTIGERPSGSRKTKAESERDQQKTSYKRPEEGARAYRRQQKKSGPSWTQTSKKKWEPGADSTRARNQRFYYKEEEVFRDIMNDPFARKVFEDIYRHVDKKSPGYTGPLKSRSRRLSFKLGKRRLDFDLGKDSLVGGVKGWLRGNLDDEQTVYFPASILMPGRKIRISVHQKFSKGPKMIEVTLPSDFQPGRPIRLRKLGKRLGPWKGDLLLTVLPEEARPTK